MLPEFFVILHGNVDLILFGIDLAKIVLKQVVQADIDVSIVIVLQKV